MPCSPLSCLPWFWSCFWYCKYFFQLQTTGTPRSVLSFAKCPSLFQRRRWVSLWTHSSTVTRSTSRLSTGERWECVEVNTVCCCWLYWYTDKTCGITTLPKQLTPCGLHQPNAATSHTGTPVHQFHFTINVQRTVEPQYCTYRLQVYYKMGVSASSWNTASDFVLLVVSEIWMHSELLFLTLCTHGHCARDCRIKMCGRKGKGCFVMYRAGNWLLPSWLHSDTIIFTAVYIFLIITTNCLTTKGISWQWIIDNNR